MYSLINSNIPDSTGASLFYYVSSSTLWRSSESCCNSLPIRSSYTLLQAFSIVVHYFNYDVFYSWIHKRDSNFKMNRYSYLARIFDKLLHTIYLDHLYLQSVSSRITENHSSQITLYVCYCNVNLDNELTSWYWNFYKRDIFWRNLKSFFFLFSWK